jgi:hypothetical protein
MLQVYISNISDVFRGMLQAFHMNVVKVDRDVACGVMVVHVCCKRLSPMFHLFFQTNVASVFHPDVAHVSHIFTSVFI